MKAMFARFVRDDQGQDLIEYALLGSFVALAAYTGASAVGTNLNTWYGKVALWVTGASNGVPAAP
jgi:pilus assembly protein Flp/PilA